MSSREDMPLVLCSCPQPKNQDVLRLMGRDPETEELMLDVWWHISCDRPIHVGTDVDGVLATLG